MAEVVKTTKSFKSKLRDRPKHSLHGGSNQPKRNGAGGIGTWGKPLDELNTNLTDGALDSGDPNYVPHEDEGFAPWSPRPVRQRRFASSLKDLIDFKAAIREAAVEYLNSDSFEDFAAVISEQDLPLYHQDIPYVLIKLGMDRSAADLTRLLKLLHELNTADIVTSHQMAQGFRKLSNALPEILIDVPNAYGMMDEAISHATIRGYLSREVGDDIRARVELLKDRELVQSAKQKINSFVREYFDSADIPELIQSVQELDLPCFNFEVIKQLISTSCDRNSQCRELASTAIAAIAGDTVQVEDVEHAFSVLLERVEDLYLDVPHILEFLSCFLARASYDEAVSPAFMVRVDLMDRDMGNQVIEQTQLLLQQPDALEFLPEVWSHSPKSILPGIANRSFSEGQEGEEGEDDGRPGALDDEEEFPAVGATPAVVEMPEPVQQQDGRSWAEVIKESRSRQESENAVQA